MSNYFFSLYMGILYCLSLGDKLFFSFFPAQKPAESYCHSYHQASREEIRCRIRMLLGPQLYWSFRYLPASLPAAAYLA